MTRLVAEDALEHAIAFAGDAVSAGAFVVMFLHGVVAVAFRTAHLPFWNWAFPSEVVHGVAARALNDDCFVSAVDELDLAPEHAHSLKCGTLGNCLVLFDIREGDGRGGCGKVLWIAYPARRDGDEYGLEAGVRCEGTQEVGGVESDIRFLVLVGDLAELCLGPSVGRNKGGLSLKRATEGSFNALNDVGGICSR